MVNPGAFKGARKEFLKGEKEKYSVAVTEGYAPDAVALIQRRFFKCFPIDMPATEEPTAEELAAIDDDTPDPEPEEPNRDNMSEFDYKMAVAAARSRQERLDFRKAQIKRWLAYQYMKDNDGRPKETGAFNPYTILMQKLTGKETTRPRQRSATNLWRKGQRETIEKHLQGEIEMAKRLGKPIGRDRYAAIRDKLARELFGELDEDTRRSWMQQAKEEHSAAMHAYNTEVRRGPSTKPEDRQRGIQGVTQFIQPVLDMISDVTGWKLTLLAGGPEPANGGRLSIISIHAGATPGDIPMTFGRAERLRYKKHIVPIFGSFLQMCYSPDECRARAIPEANGPLPMSSLETDSDEVTFHSIDSPTVASAESDPILVPEVPPNQAEDLPQSNERPNTNTNTHPPQSPPRSPPPSPPQSPSNPFPFEDVEDGGHALRSAQSPVPSPPISRLPSPIPDNSNLLAPVDDPVGLAQPNPNSESAAEPQNPIPTTVKRRKRDSLDVLADIQPGSKRLRTKSTRVLEAEEHMQDAKKGKKGGSGTSKKPSRGKENEPPKKTASATTSTRRRR